MKDRRLFLLWVLECCRRVWFLIVLMLAAHSFTKLVSAKPFVELRPLYAAALGIVLVWAIFIYFIDRHAAKHPERWRKVLEKMLESRDIRLQQRATIHIIHAFEENAEETLQHIDPAMIRKAVLVGVLGPDVTILLKLEELESLAVQAGLGHPGEALLDMARRFKEPALADGLGVGRFQSLGGRMTEVGLLILPFIAITVIAYATPMLEGRTPEGAVMVLAHRAVLTAVVIGFSFRADFVLDPVTFWKNRQARPYPLGTFNSAIEGGLRAASLHQLRQLTEEAWAAFLAHKGYRDDALMALIRLGDPNKSHLAGPYLDEDETPDAVIKALDPARADA